ncbi:MAG TPA: hypothetical protein VFX33_04565 [Actinomycetales bacterium]|nr:hypothetical protein [Actinomycetales bacterium]
MVDVLAWVLAGAALVLAIWALAGAVRNVRPSGPQLAGLAVLEVALLVQAVIGAVALARTDRPVSAVTFVGYLIASVLLLPAGTLWGIADRSRWGNGVIAIACFAVSVVVLRMVQIWS